MRAFIDRSWKGRRRPIAALVFFGTVLLAGIAFGAERAAQPPPPPAPVITSQPANPTSQTSATFNYTDSQAGVTFQCALDGSEYAPCPAHSVTYSGPLAEGKHTFRVRAASGSKTSAGATVSWTVDTTPPGVALVDPPNGALLSAAAWGQGCPGRAGLCGTAKDPSGVTQVVVSIQAENGKWWNGSSYGSATEAYQTATLVSPSAKKTEWTYELPRPQDGRYTVHVRATDAAGNATPSGAPVASTFTVDTTPPPTPSISSGPETTTTATSATFQFTDTESGLTFECRRDEANFKRCTSPTTYASNSKATHVFQVRAKDGAGNLSSVAAYTWTVVKATTAGKPFTVSGNAAGPLAPGTSRALLVTIQNPNNVPITLTALTVEVAAASTKAGCEGPSNLTITQSNISSTNTVTVPAEGQLALPSGSATAPQVLMRDLSTNQDACKGASFTFKYGGSAHS